LAAAQLHPRPSKEAATVTPGRGAAARAAERQQGPRGRYGILLLLLIVTYLLSAFTASSWIAVAQLMLFLATGLLALRSSELPRRRIHLIATLGIVGSAVSVGLAVARPNDAAVAAASIWTGLLLLATVIVIVRRILSFSTVTVQSIYGAISAYLILGLMFAAFYAAVALLHGGHFFADNRPGDSRLYQYFSFTTLTTLGYGDYTAAGSGGQAIAVMEAFTGQIFLATLVARLVAAFRGPVSPAAPGGSGYPPGSPPAEPGTAGPEPGRRPPASMRHGRQPRRPANPATRARWRRPPPGRP
jgi:hypothetical protein